MAPAFSLPTSNYLHITMGEDYSANSQSSLTNELGEVPRGILAMPFPPSLKLLPWDREDDQIGRSALRGQLHVWVQVPATMDGRGNDWPGRARTSGLIGWRLFQGRIMKSGAARCPRVGW